MLWERLQSTPDTVFPSRHRKKTKEIFKNYEQNNTVKSPSEILENTGTFKNYEHWNNEVLLKGIGPEGDPVEISGIFVWRDKIGAFANSQQAAQQPKLLAFAREKKLPIVEFRSSHETFLDSPMSVERSPSTDEITRLIFQTNYQRYEINISTTDKEIIHRFSLQQNKINDSALIGGYLPKVFHEEMADLLRRNPSVRKELLSRKEKILANPDANYFATVFYNQFIK